MNANTAFQSNSGNVGNDVLGLEIDLHEIFLGILLMVGSISTLILVRADLLESAIWTLAVTFFLVAASVGKIAMHRSASGEYRSPH